MKMNNKGVTLIELLIVIVVMGIIALFAVPAVGGILDNVEKDKLVSDATIIEEQLDVICLDVDCDAATTNLTWATVAPYVSLDNANYYTFGADSTVIVAQKSGGVWTIVMKPTENTDYGWAGGLPSAATSKAQKRAGLDLGSNITPLS